MSGRIRSIKPEVLEDEIAAGLSDAAWRLWVSMWVLADDYGDVRAGSRYLAANVWQDTSRDADAPLAELIEKHRVIPYAVGGQRYVALFGWAKHQRIDNAGKARVPRPQEDDGSWGDDGPYSAPAARAPGVTIFTYFVRRSDGAVKIGRSWHPDRRLAELEREAREPLELLGLMEGDELDRLQREYGASYLGGEWFRADESLLAAAAQERCPRFAELASVSRRVLEMTAEVAASPEGEIRVRRSRDTRARIPAAGPPTSDLRPPTNDQRPATSESAASADNGRGRGTRMRSDWQPSAETVEAFAKQGVDARRCVAEFVDYWLAVPGQKGTKCDWNATFRNRVRQLVNDGRLSGVMRAAPRTGPTEPEGEVVPMPREAQAAMEDLMARELEPARRRRAIDEGVVAIAKGDA